MFARDYRPILENAAMFASEHYARRAFVDVFRAPACTKARGRHQALQAYCRPLFAVPSALADFTAFPRRPWALR